MKNKNQIVTIFTAIILICVLVLAMSTGGIEDRENPLISAFQESGAKCMEVRLVAWKKIDDNSLSASQLEKKVTQTAKDLMLNQTILNSKVTSGWSQVIIDGNKENVEYQILGQAPDDATYMIIRAIANGDVNCFIEIKEELLNILGDGSEYNALITGQIDGNLEQPDLEKLFSKIVVASGGKLVNVAYEENYYSAGVYLDQLDNKIVFDDKTVSLQIAANYQEKEDKTYLYFGLPLVFSDY